MNDSRELPLIGFGGGCHWCTEAVFQHLIGVHDVEQGFIASHKPHDTLSEAVQLRFDPDTIPLRVLVAVHLHTHSSTSTHAMRAKYRSAIYVTDELQATQARAALDSLQQDWDRPLIVKVLPLERFELNDSRYHDYYATRPDAPFCQVHISPKLQKLAVLFSSYYKDR